MGSVCAEQQHHKFHHSHQLNLKHKILREIDIPPRRQQQLLSRRYNDSDLFMDSDDSLLHKFLPSNNLDDDDDDDSDPYSSDHFRMYEFKVRKCTRSRSHDWTDCPFAHPGEKARRRDPRRYHYSGTVCPEFRRGSCARGENCDFSHGVFECWLHPSRYRTEACKDGKNCKRKICFFAHTPRQLRVLPANCNDQSIPPSSVLNLNSPSYKNINQTCCVYCHSVAANSPTSTLLGMSHVSPPLSPSPPRSPAKPAARFSPVSRYKDKFTNMDPGGILHQFSCGAMSYKEAVNELMNSMETMQLNHHHQHQEPTSPVLVPAANNLHWVDVNFNCEDQYPNQFIMSPSNLSPAGTSKFASSSGSGNFSSKTFVEENENINGGLAGPDLGWVNDLLT